jgi:hypothetical protein
MKTRSERYRFGHNGDIDGWGGGSLHQQGEDGSLGEREDGAGREPEDQDRRRGDAQGEGEGGARGPGDRDLGRRMDFGIFETVLNETAPDVGFQPGFRKRFGGGAGGSGG